MNFESVIQRLKNAIGLGVKARYPQIPTVSSAPMGDGLSTDMRAKLTQENADFKKRWDAGQPQDFNGVLGSMAPVKPNIGRRPIPTPTLIPNAPANPHMELLKRYWPSEEVNNASNVMFGESGFKPDAIGQNTDDVSSKDYGLFQINDYWQRHNLAKKGLTPEDLLDPEKNVQYAYDMWKEQGWEPWYSGDKLGLTSRSKRR